MVLENRGERTRTSKLRTKRHAFAVAPRTRNQLRDPATVYVAGLAISGAFIPMILKAKPAHLSNFWNLPGGKVEEGETYAGAIAREMLEETGLKSEPHEWSIYAIYRHKNKDCHNLIYFMRANMARVSLHRECRTMETEPVQVVDWRKAVYGAGVRIVPNLRFLIPLGQVELRGMRPPYFEEINR